MCYTFEFVFSPYAYVTAVKVTQNSPNVQAIRIPDDLA